MPFPEQPTVPRNERRAVPRHLRDGEHDSEQMALADTEEGEAPSRSGTWLPWAALAALGAAALWWWA